MTVASDGRGQALIFPYYTVESGHTTLLSLTNHTDRAKALVVTFREALNGRPVLTFNLYLGKHDVWTAGVFALTQDGPANLTTTDGTCTVPGITRSLTAALPTLPNGQRYVGFRNFGYTGAVGDGGPAGVTRTRSGFIEIIEVASVTPESRSDLSINTTSNLGCDNLEAAWGPGGYWRVNPLEDLALPTGGLSGTVQLLDVADGALAATPATALAQFNNSTAHPAPGVTETANAPQPGSLGSAGSDGTTARSVRTTESGVVKESSWPLAMGYKAVSAALARASAGQEFLISTAIGGASDWVLNFPTRRYHTDPGLTAAAVAPFTTRFGTSGAETCEAVPLRLYDRDRTALASQSLSLCGSAQVLSFGTMAGESAVLGAVSPTRVGTGTLGEGTAELDFGGFTSTAANGGETWTGLPVIGAWFYRYSNANARPGQLGLYAGSAPLTGTARCTGEGC